MRKAGSKMTQCVAVGSSSMRFFVAVSTIVLTAAQFAPAYAELSNSGVESLGRELLDDLNPNIAHPPVDPVGQKPQSAPVDRAPRFKDLGEDIGQPSGSLSLARVRQSMQYAESLLAEVSSVANGRAVQDAGTAQKQVVQQLDKLIAELSKQCQCQGGQGQPGQEPPAPSQRSQSKSGKTGGMAGRGQAAARDSITRLDRSSAQAVEKGDIDATVKNLWGHLPERSREQMLQSFSEEFLPKYEADIEQYYRRLSEEQDERSETR
jgi:hypothetical protein